jgi:hypothetical protein
LVYTVVPETASSAGEDDTSFHFDEDGNLHSFVSGGSEYVHELWDYGMDSTMVIRWIFWIFPVSSAVYAIERRQIARHRQVILLTPVRTFKWYATWLAMLLLDCKKLVRFDPIVKTKANGVFVRFPVHYGHGTFYTTARPRSFACATAAAQVDDAIATMARLGSTNLMMPTTASWLKDAENKIGAAVLTEYHRSAIPRKLPTVYPLEAGVRPYSFSPDTFTGDEKVKLQSFMSPLIHGAFAPIHNVAAEERCVDQRITKMKKDEPTLSSFTEKCINEFACERKAA